MNNPVAITTILCFIALMMLMSEKFLLSKTTSGTVILFSIAAANNTNDEFEAQTIRTTLSSATSNNELATTTTITKSITTSEVTEYNDDVLHCFRWSLDDEEADTWWTHHPMYELNNNENTTHYCFSLITNITQRMFLEDLYRVQFPSSSSHSCQNHSYTVLLHQAGWGAAFSMVIEELMYSKETWKRDDALSSPEPIIFTSGRKGWRYAINLNDGSRPACDTRDMRCYFLNTTSCQDYAKTEVESPSDQPRRVRRRFHKPKLWADTTVEAGWIYDFATRPQAWLRRIVYDNTASTALSDKRSVRLQSNRKREASPPPQGKDNLKMKQNNDDDHNDSLLSSPCAAFHVRRADVVLNHKAKVRRYHAISEYVEALAAAQRKYEAAPAILSLSSISNNNTETFTTTPNAKILLLTDDQNAIHEALTEFPGIHWVYLDRKRHAGSEGGLQNHIPSQEPKHEVIVIQTTFRWLQQYCHDVFVHTTSSFAKNLGHAMTNNQRNHPIIINMDENRNDIYDPAYRASTNFSASYETNKKQHYRSSSSPSRTNRRRANKMVQKVQSQ